MNSIKIENIRTATVNSRAVKIFTAYRAIEGGYVHLGQFCAPVRTANKNLSQFVAV